MTALAERLERKIERIPEAGCWVWIGDCDGNGYGRISAQTGVPRRSAHRLVYELLVGPVPEGLELDHLCRVRCCVNPAHLEPVTHAENLRRSAIARRQTGLDRKTECKRGHPLSVDNTYVDPAGKRYCKTCRSEHMRTHKKKHRQVAIERTNYESLKTHCPQGHPYSVENTVFNSKGGRVCKTCKYERHRRWTADNPDRVREYKR